MRAAAGCGDPDRGCACSCSAAHVRARSYLWALAGVLSSPCSNTAPWHRLSPAARLLSPPPSTLPERSGWRALAPWARGAHWDSVPSLALANAQITPRAAFMLGRDGALPTARYSPPAPSRAHSAAARGRCVNRYTLPSQLQSPPRAARPPKPGRWAQGGEVSLNDKDDSSPLQHPLNSHLSLLQD